MCSGWDYQRLLALWRMATRTDKASFYLLTNAPEVLEHESVPDIPERMWDPLICFLVYGDPMGGFLSALVAGDLYRAALNADSDNFPALGHFGKWIGQTWPGESHGTYKKAESWKGLAHDEDNDDDDDDGLGPLREVMKL